jgi:hypothetical protein
MYVRINNNVAVVFALISKFSHNVTTILGQVSEAKYDKYFETEYHFNAISFELSSKNG